MLLVVGANGWHFESFNLSHGALADDEPEQSMSALANHEIQGYELRSSRGEAKAVEARAVTRRVQECIMRVPSVILSRAMEFDGRFQNVKD